MAVVIITTGSEAGRRVDCEGELVIGRGAADLVIADDEASRRHAVVRQLADRVEIEDLGSVNGTFVNGERISGTVTLTAEATVRIGQTEFTVEVPVPDAGPAPAGATRLSPRPPIDATVVRQTPPSPPPAVPAGAAGPPGGGPPGGGPPGGGPPGGFPGGGPPGGGPPGGFPPGGPPGGFPPGGPPGGFPPGGPPPGVGPPGGFPPGGPPPGGGPPGGGGPPKIAMLVMKNPVLRKVAPLAFKLPAPLRIPALLLIPLLPVVALILLVVLVLL